MLLVPLVLRRKVTLLDDPLVTVDRESTSEFFPQLVSQLREGGIVIMSFRELDDGIMSLIEGPGHKVKYLDFRGGVQGFLNRSGGPHALGAFHARRSSAA